MMRLDVLEKGQPFGRKIVMQIIRLMTGFRAPDVVKTLFYRGEFFGDRQTALTQLVMRGPSDWTVAEREIYAAWVSRLNQCLF